MKTALAAFGALALVVAPSVAKDFVPFASSSPATQARADVELAYEDGTFYGFGTSPNWTDNTVVNFEAPADGPWVLSEALYYVFGSEMKPAEVWALDELDMPPVSIIDDSISFTPAGTAWPPGAFTVVDVSAYGLTFNSGDLFGVGTTFNGASDGIGLSYADADGNPGHSWAIYYGEWTDDTFAYNTDDGIRAGMDFAGSVPTNETTWSNVKGIFAN
jgi:hypothetical protein